VKSWERGGDSSGLGKVGKGKGNSGGWKLKSWRFTVEKETKVEMRGTCDVRLGGMENKEGEEE